MENNNDNKVSEEDLVKSALDDFTRGTAMFKMLAKSMSKKDLIRAVTNALHADLTNIGETQFSYGQDRLSSLLEKLYNTRIILLNEVIKLNENNKQESTGEINE